MDFHKQRLARIISIVVVVVIVFYQFVVHDTI